MSGTKSRTKGAVGEREFAAALHEHLGIKLVRRLRQYQSGGCDLEVSDDDTGPVAASLGRYGIEVKRHAKATPGLLASWWAQAEGQGQASGKVPVLAYREDWGQWRVVVPLRAIHPDFPAGPGLDLTADLSVPGFAAVVRERCYDS
jgi:hypothetical protein